MPKSVLVRATASFDGGSGLAASADATADSSRSGVRNIQPVGSVTRNPSSRFE